MSTDAKAAEALTLPEFERRLRVGLARTMDMVGQATHYTYQNAVDVVALTELLVQKGVIGVRELAERRVLADAQVLDVRRQEYAGPTLHPMPPNAPETPATLVDCEARQSQCFSACCTIYNVYLTAEEVKSGKYRWELMQPYRLERTSQGHCTYLDTGTLKCTIWNDRPHVCRRYSCSGEKQIWIDFDKRVGTRATRHLVGGNKTTEADDGQRANG